MTIKVKRLKSKRFSYYWTPFIGLGFHWNNWNYPLQVYFDFPFLSIMIGLGEAHDY